MSVKPNPLREKYLAHVEQQKTSGLSIKKYCAEHDLVAHKLSYYRNYKIKSKKPSKSKAFSSVKVVQPPSTKSTSLKTSPSIDPIWLASFLKNLMSTK